jgi:hypothetical protein
MRMVEAAEGHEELGGLLERERGRLAGSKSGDGRRGAESRPEKTKEAELGYGPATCPIGEAEWSAVSRRLLNHLGIADIHPRSPLPRRLSPRSLPRSRR